MVREKRISECNYCLNRFTSKESSNYDTLIVFNKSQFLLEQDFFPPFSLFSSNSLSTVPHRFHLFKEDSYKTNALEHLSPTSAPVKYRGRIKSAILSTFGKRGSKS